MSDDKRELMMKLCPKLIKTTIDKAKYGQLGDKLSIGEIAEIWSPEGLSVGSTEWQDIVEFIAGLVELEKLTCVDRNIALGGIDQSNEDYEYLIGRMQQYSGGGRQRTTVRYKPCNASIERDALRYYFDKNDAWLLIRGFLIEKWFDDDLQEKNIEINPLHIRSPKNIERDKFALSMVEKNPNLIEKSPAEIKGMLQLSEEGKKLFSHDYAGWWGRQNIIPRVSMGGRPKKP